jgi:N6-adenosine-specific RNA methylase IME4
MDRLFSDVLYDVIYADPPWRYDFSKVKADSVENHYPTMATDDICRLPVSAAKDCVLYLWTTAPKLEDGLRVMREWGFTYKTQMVWNKDRKGYGYWFMSSHEILLVGVKGHVSPPPPALRIKSVWTEKRRKYSQKPDGIRDAIKQWFPNARRLEMFARTAHEGWDAWGNQSANTGLLADWVERGLERLRSLRLPWGVLVEAWEAAGWNTPINRERDNAVGQQNTSTPLARLLPSHSSPGGAASPKCIL